MYENSRKSTDLSSQFADDRDACISHFDKWSEQNQVKFVELMLSKMTHCQHSHVSSFLRPMLQRDFISSLPSKYKAFLICFE